MKTMRFFWMLGIISLSTSAFGQTTRAYLLQEADDYFKAGRYWDAFFRYRECAKLPEFQSESKIADQVTNSSHAMYLTKKFQDYNAMRKYEPAKSNLIELISMNPDDPHKGELPKITLAQGAELQRLAWRQNTPKATADMLKRAIMFYHQAIREGLMDEGIAMTIRQCEASIKDTGVTDGAPVMVSEPVQNGKTSTTSAQSAVPVASPRKPSTVPPTVIILPNEQNTPTPKQN
ncbi:tetratricopeptide repeat protein [Emticicia fontis]